MKSCCVSYCFSDDIGSVARAEEDLHRIYFMFLHAVALCSVGTTSYITESGRWRHRTFITGCIRLYSAFRDVNAVIIVDTYTMRWNMGLWRMHSTFGVMTATHDVRFVFHCTNMFLFDVTISLAHRPT